jgi:chromate transport protein ChrA
MPKPKSRKAKQKQPPPYTGDRTLGIILTLSALLGVCWGSVAAMLGGALGRNQSGFSGFHLMIAGILTAVVFVIMVFAGLLIMGSSRRGFHLAIGCSVINIILGALSLPYGGLGIVLGLVIIYCCRQRTSGKQGPTLLD